MKTNVKSTLLALFTISIMLGSCKKEPLAPIQGENESYLTPDLDRPYILNGQWKVVQFGNMQSKPGSDPALDDFTLKFLPNYVVLGQKRNGKTIVGKWKYVKFNPEITQPMEKPLELLAISFIDEPLLMMNDEWETKYSTASEITFKGMKSSVYMRIEKLKEVIIEEMK
jgi:hypothetical protein